MLSNTSSIGAKPPLQAPPQPAMPGTVGGASFAQFLNLPAEAIDPPQQAQPVPTAPDTASEAGAERPATTATQARRLANPTSAAKPPVSPQARASDAAEPLKRADPAGADDAVGELPAQDALPEDDSQAAGLNEFTQLIGLAPAPAQAPALTATTPATPAQDAQPPQNAQALASTAPVLPASTAVQTAQATPTSRSAQGAAPAQQVQSVQSVQPAMAATVVAMSPTPDAARGAPTTPGTPTARVERAIDEERETGAGTDPLALPATERRPTELPVTRAADTPSPRHGSQDLAAADKVAQRQSALDSPPTAATAGTANAPTSAAPTDALAPSFAAVLAQALPAAPTGFSAAPASTTSQLQAPVHSSAFAPELGASVSLMAVDGVQHAELQLNPTDMGPVSVQIVVDGAQAQVSFHAAQAETRQALEQSLPDLAAALQGQGLTLSGGGVFQQTPRDAQGGDADSDGAQERVTRGGSRDERVGAARSTAAPLRRSVGLLDTFA